MTTDELRVILKAMSDEELYEVSNMCSIIRAQRKRREKRREEAREEEESKEKELGSKRARTRGEFVKPTVEEVAAFCKKRNNTVDPVQFVSYYESKGWTVGKVRMKDWQSAVRTWERLDAQRKAERAADRKAREKRFNRSGGWTPPPVSEKETQAQLASIRKAGL